MNQRQKDRIIRDAKRLIDASGETAELWRPTEISTSSFAGGYESSQTRMQASIPISTVQENPEGLEIPGNDYTASVYPDLDIREKDVVITGGEKYRVTNVKPENCFGAITHKHLRLERIYAS